MYEFSFILFINTKINEKWAMKYACGIFFYKNIMKKAFMVRILDNEIRSDSQESQI